MLEPDWKVGQLLTRDAHQTLQLRTERPDWNRLLLYTKVQCFFHQEYYECTPLFSRQLRQKKHYIFVKTKIHILKNLFQETALRLISCYSMLNNYQYLLTISKTLRPKELNFSFREIPYSISLKLIQIRLSGLFRVALIGVQKANCFVVSTG